MIVERTFHLHPDTDELITIQKTEIRTLCKKPWMDIRRESPTTTYEYDIDGVVTHTVSVFMIPLTDDAILLTPPHMWYVEWPITTADFNEHFVVIPPRKPCE